MLGSSNSALSLGRLNGVPVRVSPGSLFVAGLIAFQLAGQFNEQVSNPIAWLVAALTSAGFLLSILLHELGHTVVAQRAGINVTEIRLWFMGGAAALERSAPTARSEMKIAAAGPAVSLAVGVVALGASLSGAFSDVVTSAFGWLGLINLVLAAFNMIPALPLDGGRVLTGWLWHRRGDRLSAIRTTARLGGILGRIGFVIAGLQFVTGSAGAIFTAFVSWIVVRGSQGEVATEELVARGQDRSVADAMLRNPATVPAHNNAAAARAMLPAPEQLVLDTHFGVVVDSDRVARGVIDLARLSITAGRDGTQPVLDEARPLDENDVAFAHEPLDEALRRCSRLPIVVINGEWQPIGMVTPASLVAPRTEQLIS